MTKVSIKQTYVKEEIIIDPYIPIKVKFGSFYSWEDITHYVRFGDLRNSMLEVGYSAETGIIHSIALVGANEINFNEEFSSEVGAVEEGIITFNTEDFGEKFSRDIISKVNVTTSKNEIRLSISEDEVVRFVQNGAVKFGLNELDEICCFVVCGFTVEVMNKLNGCLEYMVFS